MQNKIGFYGLLGLLTTGVAAAMNLVGFSGAALLLDEETFVEFRFVVNIAVIVGPLLCLGWDSAVVRLNPNQRVQLNDTAFLLLSAAALGFSALATVLWTNPGAPYALGMGLGCLFAYVIVHFNTTRSKGKYTVYFVGLNIVDKVWRTAVVIFAAALPGELMYPTLLGGIAVWVAVLRLRDWRLPRLNLRGVARFAIRPNAYQNLSFFLSSFFVFYLTRAVYFFTPGHALQDLVAIDLSMMLGAFLFVPIYSSLRIHEAERFRGDDKMFAQVDARALRQLFAIEAIILAGAVLVLWIYHRLVLDMLAFDVAITILAAMVIASSLPNMLQIAIHEGDPRIWKELGFFFIVSVGFYLGFRSLDIMLGWGAVATSLVYLAWGKELASRAGLARFFLQRLIRTAVMVVSLGACYALFTGFL